MVLGRSSNSHTGVRTFLISQRNLVLFQDVPSWYRPENSIVTGTRKKNRNSMINSVVLQLSADMDQDGRSTGDGIFRDIHYV